MLRDTLLPHANSPKRDAIAVADDGGALTYGQLVQRSRAIARALSDLPESAPVGLLLPISTEHVAAFYGILLSGRPIVPINYMLGADEIAHIVRNSGMVAVLSTPALAEKSNIAAPLIDVDSIDHAHEPDVELDAPRRGADELAVLLYTSGTSGMPKGVRLTHGNFHANVQAMIAESGFLPTDHFVSMVPLFHAFGLTASILIPMALGARVFYVKFSPAAAVNAIVREKATVTFAVPAMYATMHRAHAVASGQEFASVRHAVSGGEPLPARVAEEFRARFGVSLLEGYGLTETSPVIAVNTPACHRAGSVGKVICGVEVRIVDDAGSALLRGQDGEILVRGPNVTTGYHHLPQETAAAFTLDGFFRTGDLGHLDEDGYLFITGRKKDLIIVAGDKVVPRLVEDVLLRHPNVKDAAVVGRGDLRRESVRGEEVVAFVVTDDDNITPLSLRQFCREQKLAPFQIPRLVVILPRLPRTPTGKLLRRELKTMSLTSELAPS